MMRFIAVNRVAAQEIISDRFLQSVEYQQGAELARMLRGEWQEGRLGTRLRICISDDGVLFVPHTEPSVDYVVFDLERCGVFEQRFSEADLLLHFQKVLRFSVKTWEGMKLSSGEKLIQSTTKAVVFPYPYSQHTSFRIAIDLAPDCDRQSKRTNSGRCFLVYRSGTNEGGGPQETPSLTAFRRFLDVRKEVAGRNLAPAQAEAGISSISVTALEISHNHISPFQGYENWLKMLTGKQRNFVQTELRCPHRIEGPAGTGKTLCLVLKAITDLRANSEKEIERKALFIAHSEATRRTIEELFEANDPGGFINSAADRPQRLQLTTLQQLCADLLKRDISESEFIDRDAMESKQLQMVYIVDAVESVMASDYPTHKKFLSPGFVSFLEKTERWSLAEMLQHEIAVVIKGRAEEQLDNYRKLPRLVYGLPTENSADRGFVWTIFQSYQSQLQAVAQFDTDDIVLTTIGQLDTPIWRRRRAREGYDAIYIDETHLFNMNELSIFHHLTKSNASFPIAYSVDRSQAVGDRGWIEDPLEDALAQDCAEAKSAQQTRVQSIFRSSPDIINLAFSVTAGGATLFTNFDNPLEAASSMFTAEEERKSTRPCLIPSVNDDAMVVDAFERAEIMKEEMAASRCDVAIVAFSEELFNKLQSYAQTQNKAVEVLKERGDIEAIRRAERSKRFLLSAPEYVGGLEFQGVVLVGVDDGRVPPAKSLDSTDSVNFLSYASHNKLYVAITRAKYRVDVLISSDRGPSKLLASAIEAGILQKASEN